MRNYSTALLVTALIIVSGLQESTLGWAQQPSPMISVSLGAIEPLRGSTESAIYPEVEFSVPIYFHPNTGKTLSAALYAAYWSDGVTEFVSCGADCVAYAYRAGMLGLRLRQQLTANPVNFSIHLGLSQQFLRAKYVGGFGIVGNPGKDHSDIVRSVTSGVRVQLNLSQTLRFVGGGQIGMRLGDTNSGHKSTQWMSRFGIAYQLGSRRKAR
ncbi:MAG: hypothetical protein BMS9Abin05_0246 [Rhodothermia bacterium]|nr:MAG: hypothetical protein BMS9Abin05_0246 [Rhodothermia bacterium]